MRKPREKKRPQFRKRKKRPCMFCIEKQMPFDYKDASFVKKFMTDRGKIAPRRMTGCCALHQKWVAQMVKKSRNIGLVPYVVD